MLWFWFIQLQVDKTNLRGRLFPNTFTLVSGDFETMGRILVVGVLILWLIPSKKATGNVTTGLLVILA